MLSTFILMSAATASAAEVTDLPPQWRGDISIDYLATVVPDSLTESENTVGERRATDHDLTYSARFGFTDYLAMELALPQQASSRIAFKKMNRLVYDPIMETGTMVGTGDDADSETSGSGSGGLWLRAMATPLSESTFSARGDQITWLMGLGYQFADSTSLWNSADSGGAGPASPAFEFTSFWSTKNRMTEPYLGVVWTHRFSTDVDVNNRLITVKDPSRLDITAGLEILLLEDESWADNLGTELALDLHATFGHRSWGDGVSGVELANALSISKFASVTQGETNSLWGGADIRWRIVRYVDWTVSTEIGGPFGRRLEHPYAVASDPDGKLGWRLGTSLTFRMRDPLFDKR
jgi:hypothetical protein